ncbi:MAG: GFA family protein [Pseudohongiellaceae bacterium]|nr:GFA family protein [Pseudohongiellaceae bacterium]
MSQTDTQSDWKAIEGGCSCRAIRYKVNREPLVVHCCHCTWCQRESGSAFAVNAMVETSEVSLLEGSPELSERPTNSGKIQKIARCPNCQVVVWGHYAAAGDAISFIRVGTLDQPESCQPDIHIFTSSKQPWVILPEGKRAFAEFYDVPAQWSASSMARVKALQAQQQQQ